MPSTKKLYAAVTDANFRIADAALHITDEADAVQKTLQMRGIYFTTYEVHTAMLNGKELKGDPENRSARRYVGIDKLYSRDEVIASLEANAKNADMYMAMGIKEVIKIYKKLKADSVYITGLERPGEFIDISGDEKVFDRSGRQLWPKAATPKAAPKTAKPKF